MMSCIGRKRHQKKKLKDTKHGKSLFTHRYEKSGVYQMK
jgi:hypothetical protein